MTQRSQRFKGLDELMAQNNSEAQRIVEEDDDFFTLTCDKSISSIVSDMTKDTLLNSAQSKKETLRKLNETPRRKHGLGIITEDSFKIHKKAPPRGAKNPANKTIKEDRHLRACSPQSITTHTSERSNSRTYGKGDVLDQFTHFVDSLENDISESNRPRPLSLLEEIEAAAYRETHGHTTSSTTSLPIFEDSIGNAFSRVNNLKTDSGEERDLLTIKNTAQQASSPSVFLNDNKQKNRKPRRRSMSAVGVAGELEISTKSDKKEKRKRKKKKSHGRRRSSSTSLSSRRTSSSSDNQLQCDQRDTYDDIKLPNTDDFHGTVSPSPNSRGSKAEILQSTCYAAEAIVEHLTKTLDDYVSSNPTSESEKLIALLQGALDVALVTTRHSNLSFDSLAAASTHDSSLSS